MVSQALVARVDRFDRGAFQGNAYRPIEQTRDPLSGIGARILGGRWNPAEVLKTPRRKPRSRSSLG